MGKIRRYHFLCKIDLIQKFSGVHDTQEQGFITNVRKYIQTYTCIYARTKNIHALTFSFNDKKTSRHLTSIYSNIAITSHYRLTCLFLTIPSRRRPLTRSATHDHYN